ATPVATDTPQTLRRLAYRFGRQGARDGLVLAAADAGLAPADLAGQLAIVAAFDPGPPPVRGRDLTPLGVQGPRVGDLVRAAEELWIA
ncbi:hypothetical protein J8J27_29800, partial [Mycobacterium tuberculosis]|nr:hypothetical protein [Mycobacterium tuberculosis]